MDATSAGEAGGAVTADAPTPLILDLLEWLAAGPRAYAEMMEAWRTSCPRLTVWEDAVDLGLVERVFDAESSRSRVVLTERGRSTLIAARVRIASGEPDSAG
jgi:hypothetical protein